MDGTLRAVFIQIGSLRIFATFFTNGSDISQLFVDWDHYGISLYRNGVVFPRLSFQLNY